MKIEDSSVGTKDVKVAELFPPPVYKNFDQHSQEWVELFMAQAELKKRMTDK